MVFEKIHKNFEKHSLISFLSLSSNFPQRKVTPILAASGHLKTVVLFQIIMLQLFQIILSMKLVFSLPFQHVRGKSLFVTPVCCRSKQTQSLWTDGSLGIYSPTTSALVICQRSTNASSWNRRLFLMLVCMFPLVNK